MAAYSDVVSSNLRSYLNSRSRGDLVALLLEAAGRDPALRQRLELQAATDSEHPPTSETLTDNITTILTVEGFLDWDETRDYAEVVGDLASRLAGLHEAGHGALVLRPLRHALRLLGAAFDSVDDSAGRVGAAAERMAAVHARVCADLRPDPLELAGWLLEFQTAGYHWPNPEISEYHESLGEVGLAWYAERLTALWRDQAADYRGYRVSHLVEQLAAATDDVDLLVGVLTSNQPAGVQYHRVVETLTAAGRHAEALEWAEHGITAADARLDHSLVDFVAEQYAKAGRAADVYAIRRSSFERSRSLHTYQQLHTAATAVGQWEATRDWAVHTLHPVSARTAGFGFQTHVLVDVLLWEGAVAEAWAIAQQHGADTRQWTMLAEARAETNPDEAITVYQRLIDQRVEAKQKHAYAEAAQLAARVVTLYTREGPDQETGQQLAIDFLARLRKAHRTKRNFLAELDQLG